MVCLLPTLMSNPAWALEKRVFTDASGRTVKVLPVIDHVICSGAGCLRLLTYLQAQDRVVAVDDVERRSSRFDARPYSLANPQFKRLPLFGEFRGHDHPELILSLKVLPQVIFKTYGTMGHDPEELQQKTGIPVLVLEYGDLGNHRKVLYRSLRLIGQVMGKADRAEQVIAFFESGIQDLYRRTFNVPGLERGRCFVGGIAFRGPHGFQSTEPGYPPFDFINAENVAYDPGSAAKNLRHSNVSKENLLVWDPDILFLDLATLQMGDNAGGLYELKTDPVYRHLGAVKRGAVYGLLPYNWYAQNFGSILVNAYVAGKLIYPERFTDVDPERKADEIYSFLVGKPVFGDMNRSFGNLAFKKIPLH